MAPIQFSTNEIGNEGINTFSIILQRLTSLRKLNLEYVKAIHFMMQSRFLSVSHDCIISRHCQ